MQLTQTQTQTQAQAQEKRQIKIDQAKLDAEKFEQDLTAISTSGKAMKEAMQSALSYCISCARANKNVEPVNKLDGKLQLLESDYYLKFLRRNFSALCGYVDVEHDGNKTKFLTIAKPAFFYSSEKGKTGWQVCTSVYKARKQSAEKTSQTYFKNVIWTKVKVEKKDDKKDWQKKLIEKAKEIKDLAVRYRNTQDVWQVVNSPWVEVIKYLAAMPEDIAKEDDKK